MLIPDQQDQQELFETIIRASPPIQLSMELAKVHLTQVLDMLNKEAAKHKTVFQQVAISVSVDNRINYSSVH